MPAMLFMQMYFFVMAKSKGKWYSDQVIYPNVNCNMLLIFLCFCLFSIIEYASIEDMENALKKLDDTKLNGELVRVYEHKGDDRRDSGRGRSPRRSRSPVRRSRSPSPRRSDSRSPIRRSRSRSPDRRDERRHSRSISPPRAAGTDNPVV